MRSGLAKSYPSVVVTDVSLVMLFVKGMKRDLRVFAVKCFPTHAHQKQGPHAGFVFVFTFPKLLL